MKSCTYMYNVPRQVIYLTHIATGLFLAYLGYMLIDDKEIPYRKELGIVLVCLGMTALLYHLHIWLFRK